MLGLDIAGPAVAAREVLMPQEEPISALDEIVLLLHTAAEIEHSLLAQYIYSAYSLDAGGGAESNWRNAIVAIARQEMGHLVAIQNMLLALAGPLNFEREDYPFRQFYPFPFELRPFSLQTVARYVLAEMPAAASIPGELGFDLVQVQSDAGIAGMDQTINRVGLLYERLIALVDRLSDDAFDQRSTAWQADPTEWDAVLFNLTLRLVNGKPTALELLKDIAEQGEGLITPQHGGNSHFLQFFNIYRQVRQSGHATSFGVPTNPTIRNPAAPGFIGNVQARSLGAIANLRYRMLLAELHHGLLLQREIAPQKRWRARLRNWSLEEMRHHLSGLSQKLTSMPRDQSPQTENAVLRVAALPLELPYTLNLPAREVDRWRHHRLLATHALNLIDKYLAEHGSDDFLQQLRDRDQERLNYIAERIQETEAG